MRALRKKVLRVAAILENVGRIKRTPPARSASYPFCTLALQLSFDCLGSFFDFALELIHLAAQFFFLSG
jgi:hypothetical protein